MEQQILDALRTEFPDVHGSVVLEVTTERYNGHILSEKFRGLTFLQRQQRVFALLRKEMESKTQSISMLFTYTPDEYEELKAA
jgi:stress-induced morphogen